MNAALEAAYAATLRRIAGLAWADDIFAAPPPVGPALDALAQDTEPAHWSALRQELHNALGQIEPRQKLAVLSMACNEAPDLAEWIAHHLAIGVDTIFIYTNDNSDGTDEMLRWFVANAPVVVIPVASGPGVNVQLKNYSHALALLPELRLYEWVAVVDVDEFLLPDARYGHDMRQLLAAAPADTEALLFPWHARQWPRDFERGPGLLAERFPHALPHVITKCVTRLRHVTSLSQVHFPRFDQPRILRDSRFAIIEQTDGWYPQYRTGAGGWIEHFWGKSFEEFLVKKRRGDAMAVAGKPFHRGYEDFFAWTVKETAENHSPWPPAMLNATQARLASFATRPGFAQLQQLIATRYAAFAETTRTDPTLRQLYDDMLGRFPR